MSGKCENARVRMEKKCANESLHCQIIYERKFDLNKAADGISEELEAAVVPLEQCKVDFFVLVFVEIRGNLIYLGLTEN